MRVAGAATLFWAVLMLWSSPAVPEGLDPPCALEKGILCAELPESGARLRAIFDAPPNPPAAWTLTIWLDFGFVLLYGWLLVECVRYVSWRSLRPKRVASTLFVAAPVLDGLENIALLAAIVGDISDALARTVYVAAGTKFSCLSVGVGLLAAAAVPSTRGARVVILAATPFAILGLGGWAFPRLFGVGMIGPVILGLGLWCVELRDQSPGRGNARASD